MSIADVPGKCCCPFSCVNLKHRLDSLIATTTDGYIEYINAKWFQQSPWFTWIILDHFAAAPVQLDQHQCHGPLGPRWAAALVGVVHPHHIDAALIIPSLGECSSYVNCMSPCNYSNYADLMNIYVPATVNEKALKKKR